MKLALLYISIIFIGITSVFGQSNRMRFNRISIEQGLSQVCVNNIIQDNEGYIWFATRDGLNKYDGYNFTIYKPNPSVQGSISNNVIMVIYQDKQGTIWVGTAGGGLNKFNPETESFTSYRFDPFNKSSLSNNDVYALYEDSQGNFWVGTFGGGLNLFDRENERFISFRSDSDNPSSISGDAVRAITEDASGNLWVGIDEGGVNKFDLKTKKFTHYGTEEGLSYDVVMSLYIEDNLLYIGTYGGGLNIFDIKKESFEVYKTGNSLSCISNNIVWTIKPAGKDELYVGTRGGGINIFNKHTHKFYYFKHNPADQSSLSGNNVLSILTDQSGVVWFGTESAGINKFNAAGKNFSLIQHDRNSENTLSDNNVFSIYEDQSDNLWIGTHGGGLNKYNRRAKKFSRIAEDVKGLENIISFSAENENKFWLGTDGNGFFSMNSKGEVLHHFQFDPGDPNSVSNNAISALHAGDDKNLWIGTYGGGLNLYDQKQQRFRNFPIDRKNAMKNVVWSLFESSDNVLWVGTGGHGLVRFDKKTFRSVAFENSLTDPRSISNNAVLTIFEDHNGTIWVGTGGGGLNKFDRTDGSFKAYTQTDGLCNDFVVGIVQDDNGYLWLSTYNGISKFDPKTEEFKNFFENDGLQGNTFNERAFLKNDNGEIYFGGVNGLTYFHEDSIAQSSSKPPVVITDLKIFNKSVHIGQEINGTKILDKPISRCSELTLSHHHSVFTIEFSALHYAAPNKNLYRYKMEGFDEGWIETSAENRMATYTNLGGGKYTFMVQAANNDGVWNKEGRSLRITIIPPFYRTSWFYSIVIISVLIFIYLFIKIRERQLIKDNTRLEETVKERTQEINQQKEELKLQSELLAKNNDELTRNNILITDSISYANRIQEAVLPSIDDIKSCIPESFIFYSPRDIVSGDFYWFTETEDNTFVVAADCTGHGVPGAFMSMIGTTLLNEIVIEQKTRVPSEILEKLNIGVITALNQSAEHADSQDDGMDITVCQIDKSNNTATVACANHTMYYVEKGELKTIQGDIFSVGGIFSLEAKREFSNHVIRYSKDTMFYMFSDGYQDQFGGPKNKKFLATQFRKLLLSISSKPVDEQLDILRTTFVDWKANYKQVDDVLVFGFKL